jgi:hypothetical protein
MLQQILDNIEGILIELKDNDINFEFDVKDKRLNMFRMDINLRKSLSQYDDESPSWYPLQQWNQNNFDPKYFFDENGRMFNYISEALLTLDSYLKKLGMNVKVHCQNRAEHGFNITMKEFTEIDPERLNLVIIGIDKDHTTPKLERRINSYSQFINETFDKSSIKDFCERYLAYLLDDEDYSIELTVPRRGGTSFWTNSEGPQIAISKKGDLIRWNDVKDHMIPFLTILNKEYNCFSNIDFKIGSNFVDTTLVTHRMQELIKDFAIIHRPFNKIVISLRSNQNKFRAKRFLTEELRNINANISGGRFRMERIGKTNESLVVPRQPIDQMADTFIIEVFDKFDIDYCKPEDEEKMDYAQEAYWTFVFEDRDGKGGLLEKPYEQFLQICWLESELYTNVMNELLAVKSMVERRTGYTYKLKHSTIWGKKEEKERGKYGFITIETRDIYGNFLRPEENI